MAATMSLLAGLQAVPLMSGCGNCKPSHKRVRSLPGETVSLCRFGELAKGYEEVLTLFELVDCDAEQDMDGIEVRIAERNRFRVSSVDCKIGWASFGPTKPII